MHSTVVNGIDIPKGLTIQVDAVGLHRDPELWGPVDVDLFYPERCSFDFYFYFFEVFIIKIYFKVFKR